MKILTVMKNKFLIILILGIILNSGCEKKSESMLPSSKALEIAAATPQAEAILSYRNGVLAECLDQKAERSCDSQWITCRDDAWVVQYLISPRCPVPLAQTGGVDGRLGMNFVIDGVSGKVISHYPELEYFQSDTFCRDPNDCFYGLVGNKETCLNFIAAAFVPLTRDATPCQCQDGQCILKKS